MDITMKNQLQEIIKTLEDIQNKCNGKEYFLIDYYIENAKVASRLALKLLEEKT